MERIRTIGIDYLFFGACLIIIMLSSTLLYVEYTESPGYERSEKTGIITYREKITQRKPQSEVIWEEIINNSEIFVGDTVRTGEESSAVIRLNDGTRVSMSDNSMIQFFLSDEKINIDFLNGAINVRRAGAEKGGSEEINIKIGGKNIPVLDSDLRIFESGADINILMSRGAGAILSGDNRYLINNIEGAVIRKDTGEITSSVSIPALVEPECDKFFMTYTDSKKIRFSWDSKIKQNILEISSDKNFESGVLTKGAAGSDFSVKLGPGVYYWRVKSFNVKSQETDTSGAWRFTILKNSPVAPSNPLNESMFAFVNKPPLIDFKWEENPIALKYILEISIDTGFKNIIRSIQTAENYISVDSLGAAEYYWRVKIKTDFDEDETPEYIINKFKVTRSDKFKGIPLLKPPDKSILISDGSPDNKVVFSCGEYGEVDYYKLIISRMDKPAAEAIEINSKTNFIILEKNLPEGEYTWKFEGVLNDRGVVSKSGIRSLRFIPHRRLRVTSPVNGSLSVADENTGTANVTFSWEHAVPEGAYLIRLYSDDKMNYLHREEKVKGNSIGIDNLKPGIYFWQLFLLDIYDNRIIESDPCEFFVKEALHPPVITGPGNNIIIDILKINEIEFSWNPSPEANLYAISLKRIENGRETTMWQKETAQTSIIIDNLRNYDKGDYAWTLQAREMDDAREKAIRNSSVVRRNLGLARRLLEKPEIDTLEIK